MTVIENGQLIHGPIDEKAIGKRLRDLRKRQGMTQAELAAELGVNQSAVSDYEKGVVRIHAATVLGSSTVNAAVFARADRRPADRDLANLVRALRKAEQRLRAVEARDLAGRLPTRVVGEFADFEARLAASRGLYLPDGVVSADQLQQTIAIIRTHTPLPQSVKIPRAEDMLLQLKPSAH